MELIDIWVNVYGQSKFQTPIIPVLEKFCPSLRDKTTVRALHFTTCVWKRQWTMNKSIISFLGSFLSNLSSFGVIEVVNIRSRLILSQIWAVIWVKNNISKFWETCKLFLIPNNWKLTFMGYFWVFPCSIATSCLYNIELCEKTTTKLVLNYLKCEFGKIWVHFLYHVHVEEYPEKTYSYMHL